MPTLKPYTEEQLQDLKNRIAKKSTTNHTNCEIWSGALTGRKYPAIRFRGDLWAIHRLLMVIEHGPIPEGHEVDHKCFNMLCVNPDHLRILTTEENRRLKDPRKRGHKGGVSGEWAIYEKKSLNKWQVRFRKEGKIHLGGTHATIEEAVVARDKLVEELWPNGLRTDIEVEAGVA